MNEDVACRVDDLTTVAEGQAWQKLLLGAGGTYEVAWDTAAAWDAWLRRHERAVWEPLLTEPYGRGVERCRGRVAGHGSPSETDGLDPGATVYLPAPTGRTEAFEAGSASVHRVRLRPSARPWPG